MKFANNPVSSLLITIAVFLFIHACAGMGSIRGQNVRIYYENIDKMVDITRQAIRNKGYNIREIDQRRESSQRTKITFVNRSTAGQQMVNSMQSYVIMANVDTAEAVSVRIHNPDYSYGTPTDQRIDYAKVLFPEIDRLLETGSR